MEKDYKNWHLLKQSINNKNVDNVYFKEREIWFCYFGCNIGFEQDGKGDMFLRPVLILKKFNKNIFLCIPLSSSSKNNKFYHRIKINNKDQSFILSQSKIIDSKRLKNKRYILSENDFNIIKKAFIDVIS